MRLAECLLALLVAGIYNGAVGEDEPCTDHHAVAISMHTAIHARSIVTHDATYHGAANGSRVGREDASEWLQNLVDARAHDARLHADGVLVGTNLVFLPVLSGNDKHRVADALTRKRCAGGTEGERQLILVASANDACYFLLAVAPQDDFRNLAIETGICTPPQRAELVGIDAVGLHELSDLGKESLVIAATCCVPVLI